MAAYTSCRSLYRLKHLDRRRYCPQSGWSRIIHIAMTFPHLSRTPHSVPSWKAILRYRRHLSSQNWWSETNVTINFIPLTANRLKLYSNVLFQYSPDTYHRFKVCSRSIVHHTFLITRRVCLLDLLPFSIVVTPWIYWFFSVQRRLCCLSRPNVHQILIKTYLSMATLPGKDLLREYSYYVKTGCSGLLVLTSVYRSIKIAGYVMVSTPVNIPELIGFCDCRLVTWGD
jgi:hypothetical protein